ncbi:MAG: DUF1501 domain-containing protein [Planctomycetota bacterium]|nr:DUF1501 domain-containing protein [Planctomycetota bacterium]
MIRKNEIRSAINTNPAMTRREMLTHSGMGFGLVGLAGVMNREGMLATTQDRPDGLSVQSSRFVPKAKRVIHIFLNGGPSQIDTFDPKPELEKWTGEPLPGSISQEKTGSLMPSCFKFQKYGKSGIDISELFADLGEHADDLCILRGMHTTNQNHEQMILLMNTGSASLIRPSVGSWLTYGLGSLNENLPGYIALCQGGFPWADSDSWRSAFLPGSHQGTFVDVGHKEMNKLNSHPENKHDARIRSYETGYRMQVEATDAFDVEKEPKSVLDMYGDTTFGRKFIMARRLVERGVRYVQVFHSRGGPWDHHQNIETGIRAKAKECSGAIAALLKDLKARGLLEDTLVICGGEFGRTPFVELRKGNNSSAKWGRDHNNLGFSIWLAGGGVKGGHIHGKTDEFGYASIDGRVHVHDLHATILHLLGLDHERLTYRYSGRDFRLTNVQGNVVKEILA